MVAAFSRPQIKYGAGAKVFTVELASNILTAVSIAAGAYINSGTIHYRDQFGYLTAE
jgi:hypothetical protein